MSEDKEPPKTDEKALSGGEDSGIPGFGMRRLDADATTTFEAFWQPGRYTGINQGFGGVLLDRWRLFYSVREPAGVWWIRGVADDLWDNWFKVKDVAKPDSDVLDKNVQKILLELNAKTQLPRETVFERRYGTSILLLSYSVDTDWETPLDVRDGVELMMMTPYPWTMVNVSEVEEDDSSLRFGLPMFYEVTRGASNAEAESIPIGTTSTDILKVHWTRVIHDAPRLDEHPYLGLSALDPVFDDLVGGRNARWAMYQYFYRYGGGFPVFKTKGTQKENEEWVAGGGPETYLNARGYFVCGPDEDVTFVGTQGTALNPSTYFDTYFTFLAAATGVAQDTIKGVSAGRVTGSEVNERQYFKAISLQQHKKEPMLRELIDRIIETGQVDFDGDYVIEWVDPFEVNPQDKAAIEYMEERTNALRMQSETIDEVRARKGMPPLPDGAGEMLLPQPGQFGSPSVAGAPNQTEPERPETEPEETTKPESTLLDKTMKIEGFK